MNLDARRLRFLLALVVVGGYVILVGIITVAIVATDFDRDSGIEIIEEISKVMAGFMGLVIGYYFSRAHSADE